MIYDQDLADAAQEYVESCECQDLCEHGFSDRTSERYGEKPWFHLGFSDGQRNALNYFQHSQYFMYNNCFLGNII
jgi:hypothetical protein